MHPLKKEQNSWPRSFAGEVPGELSPGSVSDGQTFAVPAAPYHLARIRHTNCSSLAVAAVASYWVTGSEKFEIGSYSAMAA